MDRHDFINYYVPAFVNIMGTPDSSTVETCPHWRKFDDLIGRPLMMDCYLSRSTLNEYPMSDELKDLLIKLATPNGKAILKAYRIQKGYNNEDGTLLPRAGKSH